MGGYWLREVGGGSMKVMGRWEPSRYPIFAQISQKVGYCCRFCKKISQKKVKWARPNSNRGFSPCQGDYPKNGLPIAFLYFFFGFALCCCCFCSNAYFSKRTV